MPHKPKNPVSEMVKLAFNCLDLPSQRQIINDLLDEYFSNAKKTIAASTTSGAQ